MLSFPNYHSTEITSQMNYDSLTFASDHSSVDLVSTIKNNGRSNHNKRYGKVGKNSARVLAVYQPYSFIRSYKPFERDTQ